MERVKRWWRTANPQIAVMADGSDSLGGFADAGTIERSQE